MRGSEYSLAELGEIADMRMRDALTNQELLAQTLQHPDIAGMTGLSPLVIRMGKTERQFPCVATSLTWPEEPTSELAYQDGDVHYTRNLGRGVVRAAFLEPVGEDVQLHLVAGDYASQPRNIQRPLHEVAEAVLTGQGFKRRIPAQDHPRNIYLPKPEFLSDKGQPELLVNITDDAAVAVTQERSSAGDADQSKPEVAITCVGTIGVVNPYPSLYSIANNTIYRPITREHEGILFSPSELDPFRARVRKEKIIRESFQVSGGLIHQVNPEVDPKELGSLTHPIRLTMSQEEFVYRMARGGESMWTSGAEHFKECFKNHIGTYMLRQVERTLTPQKLLAEADPHVVRPNKVVETVPGILNVVRRLCQDFAPTETEQNARGSAILNH